MTIADWQGDTFTAAKAKELGLIDEIVGKMSYSRQLTNF